MLSNRQRLFAPVMQAQYRLGGFRQKTLLCGDAQGERWKKQAGEVHEL